MNAVPRVVSFGMRGTQKYRNKPTMVDGIRFHSKREARRYQDLQLLERNGEIRNIRRQVAYRIDANGEFICRYYADFVYEERDKFGKWLEIVEDVKGYKTPEYRLKKRLMAAIHHINLRET